MRNGAEGDADIARERSRVGAGGAYREESKRVGTVGVEGEFEMLDFDAATLGRFYVLAAAYKHGWTWLVIVAVLATLVSLYYYLGVVRAMYMRPSAELQVKPVAVGGSPAREQLLHAAVGIALAVSVGSLFAVQPLIDLAKHAASSLSF